ncbi:ABC transporter substrate-binding protein [Kocuria sp. LUK]|uniref:ABC transporter substrate-binding protein n=1 Tax=Kocuria sp. LUK TaxID=2897828 RepID=UPI001E657DA4|nr:ABC transporter substrate-binding protein [Kocuria sp. LUK]MCD1145286.1 ABC transporter substrate-binding protein [Kocuria sp. LUK]
MQPQDRPEPTTVTAGAGARPAGRRGGWPLVLTALLLLAALTATATVLRGNGTLEAWQAAPVETSEAADLRLGYFGNLTHGPALVGLDQGLLAEELGGTELSTQVFGSGPTAVEAMNAGSLDAAFVGPNPAINSFVQSEGRSLAIVAGAASGGAQFVVSPDVAGAGDLGGRTLATPEFGGTQDVALRTWLAEHGYVPDGEGEDAVAITPMPNGQTLHTLRQGRVDGAWLPQPWATRAVAEGARVLVDERELWPGGRYPTTVLVVRRDYLERHPRTVERLVRGLQRSVDWLEAHEDEPALLAATLNRGLERAEVETLPEDTVTGALAAIEWTTDPLAGTYPALLEDAVAAGTTDPAPLEGLVDPTALERVRPDPEEGA